MADVVSRGDLFSPCRKASILPVSSKKRGGPCPVGLRRCSSSSPPFKTLRSSLSIGTGFHGRKLVVDGSRWRPVKGKASSSIQMALMIGKAMKWWVKGIQPNMREIESAQDLVDSLANAGDKLVVVDFFSPGCAGCRALHPKICQIAGMNPDVQFLQINYEEHKSMCYSLNVHVLPFFRFYSGAQGRVCSFSCTNATIKKFKDALAKHNTDGCSLGVPAKGLEEKELVALAANKELGFTYTPKPEPVSSPDVIAEPPALPAPVTRVSHGADKVLTTSGI